MQINTLNQFLERYIEGYLFADLASVQNGVGANENGNASYLMLSGLCAGIEFLGYVMGRECEVHHGLISTAHSFEDFCDEYLVPIDARYHAFGAIGKKLIRNGIMHNFATKGMIGVTRRGDRSATHLVRYTDEAVIIINPDYLFEDLKKAYYEFVVPKLRADSMIRNRANRNYTALRDQDARIIAATVSRVVVELEEWPWLYREIETTINTAEIIEENGDLPIVS